MKRLLLIGGIAFLTAGCGARQSPVPRSPVPLSPPAPAPAANVVVEVQEIVSSRESESFSATWVYVAGKLAGKTNRGLKSELKIWSGRLPPGNYPLRFERWILEGDDTWRPAKTAHQPPERFIRMERNILTRIQIRYYEGGHRHSVTIERSPLMDKEKHEP